ncbi:thiamine diphosphokinase [Beggiatoa leptomitoformis]|uniref:Thiamine diphosphokinase n=1 Tax=Beggiatoa leptomitoformis TaxID=288004 RepID=A0A2N9YH49_9GAMM|nr:thiamine diphosphokinase [Beggiatoa leptomitoformis]ALG69421.2 thiamine diphosphokinase [Beggiatoa leptomitoformis]AUI69827.1 thiamine diphosphokinase [Beggiatoa leptomitoformis]
MKPHILIVANGSIHYPEWYQPLIMQVDLIIAADGGANNCLRLGIMPDYVIGDLDSITPITRAQLTGTTQIIEDPDQNKTDLELAFTLAQTFNPVKLSIIGAIGTRLDHTLSNIISLDQVQVPCVLLDEHNDIYLVQDYVEITGQPNDIISILPISAVEGLTYTGLKWSVDNLHVNTGWLGTSNRLIGTQASIRLQQGKVVVIKARENIVPFENV